MVTILTGTNNVCAFFSALLLLSISMIFVLEAPAEENKLQPPDRVYVFKGSDSNPPFEFLDNGQPAGMNAELLRRVAQIQGFKIHIELGPWERVYEEFITGQIDGLTGLNHSDTHKQNADFAFPSVISSYSLFVRNDSYEKSFKDGWNGSIIVKAGDLAHDYLIEKEFNGPILVENSFQGVLHRLAEGHGDGALLPQYQGIYLCNHNKLKGIVLSESALFPWAYGFAVQPGNDLFLRHLNEGLYKFAASGEYFKVWSRWCSETLPQTLSPYIGYLFLALAAIIFLLLLITSWTYVLRREVNRRTKSLSQSEERYRTLFENSNDALFLLRDKIVDCNQQAYELLGVQRPTLLNTTLASFAPVLQQDGTDSATLFATRIKASISGEPQVFPWVHVRSDGEPVYTEISLRVVPGLTGPICMAAVRDLSDRIKAEQAARRQQDLVRAITGTCPVGIVMLNAQGVITFANAHAERILRLEHPHLYDRTYNDPQWKITAVDGGTFREDDLPFYRVMRTGKPVYDIIYAIHQFEEKRTILSVSAAPVFTDTGVLDGVVSAFEDITAKVEEEERHNARWQRLERQQEALLRIARKTTLTEESFRDTFGLIVTSAAEVLNVSFSSLWILDENRNHLRCIASSSGTTEPVPASSVLDLRAYPAYKEALESGRHIDAEDAQHDPRTADLVADYLAPNSVGALLDAPIRLGGKLTGVLCNEHRGGIRRWLPDELQFAAELADQASQALASHDHFRAEQERHLLEERMQQTQRFESLGILAGGIAHDFNNLLTAILGNVDLALMDMPPSNLAETALNEIKALSTHAADLCLSLLIYAGKGRAVTQSLNLNEEIRRTSQILGTLNAQNIRLIYRLSEKPPEVNADRGQIQQVIMNLVLNASEAITGEEGTITIKTYLVQCDSPYFRRGYFTSIPDEGLYVAIEVSDTGMGITEEECQKIFNPFYSTKFVGRGLGLCAVLGIVNGHKGCIRIQSSTGQGSTFTVLLPADTKAPVTSASMGYVEVIYAGPHCVLVIDGNSMSLKVTVRILSRLGYTVLHAVTLENAASLLRDKGKAIHCVLLDHALGQALVEKQIEELRHACNGTPLLLATDLEKQEFHRLYGHFGFSDFLEKPLRVAALAAKLSAVIENKSCGVAVSPRIQ